MSAENISEERMIKGISSELRKTGSMTEEQKQNLSRVFQKRLSHALALIDANKIVRYRFQPSGRVLWVVQGRQGEYQIIPESLFCTCDDYYFRVMGNQKQLCYHLVAQQIAEPLSKYREASLPDSNYADLTSKWADRVKREK